MTVYPPLFPCRTPAQDCQKEVVKNHILHFLLPHQHRFYLERPSGLIFRCSIHWYLFDEEPVTNFPSHQTQTPVTGSWRGWAMAVRHIVAFWMWLLCLHKWIGGTSSGTKMKLVMTSDRKNQLGWIQAIQEKQEPVKNQKNPHKQRTVYCYPMPTETESSAVSSGIWFPIGESDGGLNSSNGAWAGEVLHHERAEETPARQHSSVWYVIPLLLIGANMSTGALFHDEMSASD